MSDSFRPYGLLPARLLCLWGFSRWEYQKGLPCLPPGDLPSPGIEPVSPASQVDFSPLGRLYRRPYIFSWAPKSLQMVTAAMKLKDVFSLEESYDKPGQRIKKQRCYFTYKGPYHQSYGFSSGHIWMWELTIKKVERKRIDAFELWCWRRLLRVPWTSRRSNQSIVKEINPDIHWKDWCWSWSSNTLATWCKALNN